jgi:hypothetical protein
MEERSLFSLGEKLNLGGEVEASLGEPMKVGLDRFKFVLKIM